MEQRVFKSDIDYRGRHSEGITNYIGTEISFRQKLMFCSTKKYFKAQQKGQNNE
jgi:hypothetical protein